jgi:hypothetical protein
MEECQTNFELCLSGESTLQLDKVFVQTSPIVIDHVTFMVTRAEPYTPFEKLLLPFDNETWYTVVVTFLAGYFAIFIIYRFPRKVQEIFFGEKNDQPSLGLTRTFFGDGLTREPTKHFARIIFMIFTWYCLIIRTAYQGKMFDFLHSNTEKSTPETMEQLIKMQIPIYSNWDNKKLTKGVEDYL